MKEQKKQLTGIPRLNGCNRDSVGVDFPASGSTSSSVITAAVKQIEVGEQLHISFLLLELGIELRMRIEFFEDSILQRVEHVFGDGGLAQQSLVQTRNETLAVGQFHAWEILALVILR